MRCPACGVVFPLNGHRTGGASCMQRQLSTARAAVREYLAAHAALVDAGGTHDRPDAARRVADAWIALGNVAAVTAA